MNIVSGNLFEAMRLVLPEHRTMMAEREKAEQRKKQPMLSEDQKAEMHYRLTEALVNRQAIRVTLYAPYGEESYTGMPVLKGSLYLRTEKGMMRLDLQRMIEITLLGLPC